MEENRKNIIAAELNKRGIDKPCPRCGEHRFEIVDETSIKVEPPGVFLPRNRVLPVVIILCATCGWVTLHSSAVLGLLPGNSDGK